MEQQRQIKLRNLIAYGFGDFYGGGSFFLVSTFAMYYLITVVGLSPILAGLVPGVGKLWDAFADTIMGHITDHTRSRFGRRRVYFLIAIIPVFVTFVLIWVPMHFGTQLGTFLYYMFAYIFFYTVFTMAMVPYSALSAEMSQDFKERNRLTGARMIFSILATLVGALSAQPIIDAFPDPEQGHLVMALVFGVLFAIPWIFVFLGTWELPHVQTPGHGKFFSNFRSLFKNRSFLIHIGMYICSYTALDILMGWIKFYLIDYLGRPALIQWVMGFIVLFEFLLIPVYIFISNRWGHARAYFIGLILCMTGMGLMYLQTPATPLVLLSLNCVLIGAGLSAGILIPWTVLPFLTDVDELMTTKKRAGIYAGSMTLLRKLIQGALVIPLLGVLLTVIGYRTAPQEELTLSKLSRQAQGLVDDAVRSSAVPAASWELRLARLMEKLEGTTLTIRDGAISAAVKPRAHDLRQAYDAFRMAETTAEKKAALAGMSEGTRALSASLEFRQDRAAVEKLRLLFVIVPILFIIVGLALSLRFRINPRSHEILMREIERLKTGGARDQVDPSVRLLCEELTGQSYDTLYRSER